MRTKLMLMALAALLAASCNNTPIQTADSGRVDRIEPPCWWVGMETSLQLLIKGEGIGAYNVKIDGPSAGVKVTAVHAADSPNYLFADVKVGRAARPGTYSLVFSDGTDLFSVPYEISERRSGSSARQGFGPSDMIYLIMPDRFANGDPSNDNSPLCAEQADPQAFFGRHGGDIAGIRSHLDYMQDLGVTAIWCTPLLMDNEPVASYHGYACADYYNVDPRIGTNDEYREFVADAHAHGIKVISDVVTNHCGSAHWWMADPPFADWVHVWPEYTHSNCSFAMQNSPYCSELDRKNMVEGWFDTSMPDINLDNPFVLQYFKQWAAWLIEWADLDGLRVDTFPYNEKGPISEWCASVRREYPDINIVGEVWSNNISQVAYWQGGAHNFDGYDSHLPSVMDFPLMSAMDEFNTDRTDWENGMVRVYESIANDVYLPDPRNIMIFCGNHDTDRIADRLGRDPRKLKMAFSLMATLRGFPQVFAGDEIAAVSRDRRQGHGGLRVEFDDNWRHDAVSLEVHDWCKALFGWRRTSKAVAEGRTVQFLTRDNTYAFFRLADDEAVFVYVNNTTEPKAVPWQDYAEIMVSLPAEGRNVVTSEPFDPSEPVAPKSSIVIEFK